MEGVVVQDGAAPTRGRRRGAMGTPLRCVAAPGRPHVGGAGDVDTVVAFGTLANEGASRAVRLRPG